VDVQIRLWREGKVFKTAREHTGRLGGRVGGGDMAQRALRCKDAWRYVADQCQK